MLTDRQIMIQVKGQVSQNPVDVEEIKYNMRYAVRPGRIDTAIELLQERGRVDVVNGTVSRGEKFDRCDVHDEYRIIDCPACSSAHPM